MLPGWWPVPRGLAESGKFVCLACDFGDPDVAAGPTSGTHSWGNDNALSRMSDAYELLLGPSVRAKAGPVLLAGSSMGAVVALNWALRHREHVCAVILACPVLDLNAMYAAGPESASIGAAYGVSLPAPLPEVASHSPVEYAPDLAGLPIRIYASSNDPIAATTSSCLEFADRVGGGNVNVVDLGDVGHWPVGTPIEDALAFACCFL